MSSIDNTSEIENPRGLKFEDAVVKLNQIVERMESTDVDLDKMIENYQSGLSLYIDLVLVASLKLTEKEATSYSIGA
ncbi:MAG: exodeoxyribonuclease VII small subunit [Rhodobacteraceae bacterium]|nr:exodeoxyribonuclease VII small subunit [Paracoccaceae bacterium]